MADEMIKVGLKKDIGLLGVYAVATGATLSAGFFLLPGLAAQAAGSALVLAYMVAAIPLVPAMFSIIELATAMPRAGGVYYFLDRSLGPLVGTVGGIGTWLALVLKVAFALVGMGAYINLFVPELPMIFLSVGLAIALGILNLLGAKKSGSFQIILMVALMVLLTGFIGGGIPHIQWDRMPTLFEVEYSTLMATAGLVFISYVGVTNVASLSEEVKDPERNLPLGVILSLATAVGVYALVMVGVLPMEELAGNLTPVAAAAEAFLGPWGSLLLSFAALFAFTSVANAGTLSASRYPLAMSRDHMMPKFFQQLSSRGAPHYAVLVTVGVIVLILIFLDPLKIAKLASAFQLLIFALVCLAVMVMRESGLASYDSGYHSPLYPWMQLFGIVSSGMLIYEMGWLPSMFSAGLVVLGTIWYFVYAKDRVVRNGAIYHMFERWGQKRYSGLDAELRGILKEKGLRDEDPFDEVVARSLVIDLSGPAEFEEVTRRVSEWLSGHVPHTADEIEKQLLDRTHMGATPVTHGVGLPHLRIDGIEHGEMVLVRANQGIHIQFTDPLTDHTAEERLTAIFYLFSPVKDPSQHLRILAQIARRVDDESFLKEWQAASNELELKETLLHNEDFLSLTLRMGAPTAELIGCALKEVDFPDGCLVALLRRGGSMLIPRGDTVLHEDDRLTVLGAREELEHLSKRYQPTPSTEKGTT